MAILSLRGSVGIGGANNKDDVATSLELLRLRRREAWYSSKVGTLVLPEASDPKVAEKLGDAIKVFQSKVQGLKVPDGLLAPTGNGILFAGGVRSSGKQIIVDLDDQVLYAYEGSLRIYEFDCASGDSKHPTADGPVLFQVTRKESVYRSKKYDAQMDYAMFFSDDGKAIHQSNAVGLTSFMKNWGVNYFGSHGCVRLEKSEARELFQWTPAKTPVFIDMSRKAFD